MVLARFNSGAYQLVLFLHILSVIVAFAPAVVHSLTGPRLMKEDEAAGRKFLGVAAANDRMVYLPALLVVGILGLALVVISDDVYKFSDPWVSISALLWLVIGGIIGAVIVPAERKAAGGDRAAESRLAAAGGIATLLLLVVLFLMVVKPG